MEKCLIEVGISFLFAQMLHPAMKYAMPVRKELGTRTIFNILGPLCNPAQTKNMVIGVYSEPLCQLIAEAALKIGKEHIMVVHGRDGLDEITTTSSTRICEVRNGEINEYEFSPETAGIQKADPFDILGGSPDENAKLIREILSGSLKGPKRDIVILNTAAAIITADKTDDWQEAAKLANESIDSGRALAKLEALIECSSQA